MTRENIALLFDWGKPKTNLSNVEEWKSYLDYGFSSKDVPHLIPLLTDESLYDAPENSNDIWVPLYAWRILGALKSDEAIQPLIDMFEFAPDDDWVLTDIPYALGMIGRAAIEPLFKTLLNESFAEFSRVAASDSLIQIAKQDSSLRDEIVSKLGEYLRAPDVTKLSLNGLLVCGLIDVKAIELMDDIRLLFEHGYVDISIPGDLEDVEIALGTRSKRDTPKPHYGKIAMGNLDDLSLPKQAFNPHVKGESKIGRNDPCICGSGKKYKRCCLLLE